jgi:hypothetical protein
MIVKRWLLLAPALALAPQDALGQLAVLNNAVQESRTLPGQSYRGVVLVRNVSPAPIEAKVYLTDYLFSADGSSSYADPGTAPRSSASWITLDRTVFTLGPGAETAIGYEVSVPEGGSASGTYWSMIMVEDVPRGSRESSSRASRQRGEIGLQTRVRHGVQVVTNLGDTGATRVEFANPRVVAGAARALEYDLVNTGERAFRPAMRVEFHDEQGRLAHRVEATRGLLYPGTSLRQQVPLSNLPSGTYQVLVLTDTGGESIFAAQYTLTL